MQAALLRCKLPRIGEYNEGRRQVAKLYTRSLQGLPHLETPYEHGMGKHIFHQYTIRIKDGKRDRVQNHLRENGISSIIYYPYPLHQMPLYAQEAHQLPQAELASQEVISLPMWPTLGEEQAERITSLIKEVL
jgi:dTDP-4-amino-4,6-dideoxygalactose transaminase